MRLSVYEGTPDEIAQIAAELPSVATAESKFVSPVREESVLTDLPVEKQSVSGRKFVSLKIARLVLSRRKLSPEQLIVLRAIFEAHPRRVPAPDLQKLIGYTTAQFAGLMGAFGRRLSHTKGYVDDTWFIDPEWNYDLHYNEYGLPDSVREALKVEQLV